MIEVETNGTIDVEVVGNAAATSTGGVDVEVVDLGELDITVAKKEYVITGDDIYIPVLYDDAPQWMKDLVAVVVDVAVETSNTQTLAQLTEMLSEFATGYVPMNQYTQSIVDLSDADERMNLLIETLNSNFNDGLSEANAQIVSLESTKASKSEVVAQVVDTIAAQLATPGSDLQAVVARLDQAIVTETQARALSFQVLTSSLNNVNEGVSGNATAINTINTYVGIGNGSSNGTGALADIAILQKQNDGVIETITGVYDVMLNPQDPNLAELVVTAEPYRTWKAADVTGIDTRLKHIGDVYIKYSVTDNGARQYIGSYKFIRTAVDASDAHKSTDADGFTWALVVDQAAQDAYNQALNAYDLADSKRRVFTSTPFAPIDEGDLWVTGTNPQVTKVYKSGVWDIADTQVAAFVSNTYTPTITNLQSQIDGKVESWFTVSTSDPKTAWTDTATRSKHDGDMWYQTDTKKSYYYSSSTNSWNLIDDAKAIQALADAAAAQASADGKITSYYIDTFANVQVMSNAWTTVEKTNNVGDLATVWNDGTLDNNGTWRWNGTSWVSTRDKKLVSLASDVTTLRTDLNSGTGTWATADSVVSNTLSSSIAENRVEVEAKWAYNSNVNIAGTNYNSGFGIATSLTTGSGLPVGQSEFWVKADKFRLMSADGSMKSSYSPFTVNAGTGDITFNGKVEFSNVNGAPTNTSSSNLIKNSEFQDSVQPWSLGWNPNGSNIDVFTLDKYAHTSDWILTGQTKSLTVHQNGRNASTANYDTAIDIYPQGSYYPSSGYSVMSGTTYEFSAYIAAHRCKVSLGIQFFNSSGGAIAGSESAAQVVGTGGKALDNYTRVYTRVVAPSGSVTALLYLRKFNTDSGYTDSWIWVARPFFGNVDEKSAAPVPYVASDSSNSSINNNNDIFAQKLGYANYSDMVTAANNGQTIINGGYLRTNLIQSGSITAGLIDANAISGKTISGGVITGTNIYGANIEGSVIKASFIDLTSTATLTNWQQYNSSNYPSQYASNFAHKNDGSLLVDSLGYVRLMGNTYIVTTAVTYNSGTTYRRWDLPAYSLDYYGYDDYKNSNINRCIYPNPTLNINSSKRITYINLIGSTTYNSTNTCYASFTVHEDSYVCVATGYQGSSAGTESASGNITKNGVVIQSFSNVHGTTRIQVTTVSGGIPITITVGCSLGIYGGMSYSVIVQSTNTLSTSTQVNYSGSYGTPFKLMSGYLTYGATASVDVPAITI